MPYQRQTSLTIDELFEIFSGKVRNGTPRCMALNEIGLIAWNQENSESNQDSERATKIIFDCLNSANPSHLYIAFCYLNNMRKVNKFNSDQLKTIQDFEKNPAHEEIISRIIT